LLTTATLTDAKDEDWSVKVAVVNVTFNKTAGIMDWERENWVKEA